MTYTVIIDLPPGDHDDIVPRHRTVEFPKRKQAERCAELYRRSGAAVRVIEGTALSDPDERALQERAFARAVWAKGHRP